MRTVAITVLAALLIWSIYSLAEWIIYRNMRATIWRYYENR